MENLRGKHRWGCERCLSFTHNNKKCPPCGYTHLSKIKTC